MSREDALAVCEYAQMIGVLSSPHTHQRPSCSHVQHVMPDAHTHMPPPGSERSDPLDSPHITLAHPVVSLLPRMPTGKPNGSYSSCAGQTQLWSVNCTDHQGSSHKTCYMFSRCSVAPTSYQHRHQHYTYTGSALIQHVSANCQCSIRLPVVCCPLSSLNDSAEMSQCSRRCATSALF